MSKRVLIVDDAAFMRMMIKNVLTQNGYEVAGEASNGQEALVLYEKVKPDLVACGKREDDHRIFDPYSIGC